jgi:hypothetical protein
MEISETTKDILSDDRFIEVEKNKDGIEQISVPEADSEKLAQQALDDNTPSQDEPVIKTIKYNNTRGFFNPIGLITTDCPYKNIGSSRSEIKVGSESCSYCKHHVSQDYINKTVECSYKGLNKA